MRWAGLVIGCLTLHAQLTMPVGVVHGDLVSWSGSARSGELQIRAAEHNVYSCLFDLRTYFERDRQVIAVTSLTPGDPVEIVADRKPGSSNCYARTVEVVQLQPPIVPGVRPRFRTPAPPTEAFAPRGDFFLGGVVIRQEPLRLTVRTRAGEIHVVLRKDTRYLGGGLRLDASEPLVNKHVFVRAGRDVNGLLEAYQVVWGEIVAPQ